jgi:hypothetical protein
VCGIYVKKREDKRVTFDQRKASKILRLALDSIPEVLKVVHTLGEWGRLKCVDKRNESELREVVSLNNSSSSADGCARL